MIKFLTLRIIRWRLKSTLPRISSRLYTKLFSLTYKFFYLIKPSQLWVIILALLNKADLTKLISIPSIFMLFSTLLSESDPENLSKPLDKNLLNAKLTAQKFNEPENNWEGFFWVLIILALIKRLITKIFKLLWIPFKLAFIFYTLKYLGYDFSYLFDTLNNLSLGVIDWFYDNITKFFNLFNKNDKNN